MKRKLVVEIEGEDNDGHVEIKVYFENFNTEDDIPASGFTKFSASLLRFLREPHKYDENLKLNQTCVEYT